eukprot:scaffold189624_cov28-Prasinocladus_malaysianus.AAC.2
MAEKRHFGASIAHRQVFVGGFASSVRNPFAKQSFISLRTQYNAFEYGNENFPPFWTVNQP